MFAWVSRLGVAGIEPVGLAMGISQRTTYSHVERLVEHGLLRRVLTAEREGGVLVLTRPGARVANERGVEHVLAANSRLMKAVRHGQAVSWVAAAAERRGTTWLGPAGLHRERAWRVHREDGARHAPDLGLVVGDLRVAVEVELSPKSVPRLRAILRGYRVLVDRGTLDRVTYICESDDVARLMGRQAAEVGLSRALATGSLAQIQEQVRDGRKAPV